MRISNSGALLAALLFVAACGGDDNDDSTGPSGNGTVTASVGGSSFSGSLAVQATLSSGVLSIGATQSAGGTSVKQINLNLVGVSATGTFSLGGISANIGTYTETAGTSAQVWTTAMPGSSGTVTITEFTSDHAKGTFSFVAAATTSTGATGTKTVTNGSFNVHLH